MKTIVTFACERLSLAIVAIGTILMALVFAVVEYNGSHLGLYPFILENNTDRIQVQSGPSAGALHGGDRIDLGALTPQQRFSLIGGAPAHTQMQLRVVRSQRTLTVPISAGSPNYSRRATLTRDVGIPLCFFLSLALASVLFLMRPRPITFAFYVYTILMLVKINEAALDLARWPINLASDLAIQVVYPLTQLMILVFAQRLYGRPSRAWPWFFGSAIVLSVVVFVVWLDPIVWTVFQRYAFPGPTNLFMALSDTALLVVVLAALAYIASGAKAIDRNRVTWVIAGIALSPIIDLAWAITNLFNTLLGNSSMALLNVQNWTTALLPWFGLVGSIFVLYGFLSERVVDFRFIIGRAAVYGAITAALLVLFGTLEWATEQIFESTQPAIYLSLFTALFIGFSFNSMHGRIELFLNAFFFREEHRAHEALQRAARALANTSSETTLVEFLVDEPVRVLGLALAALFVAHSRGGAFERMTERGWKHSEPETIDPEDPIIAELRADLSPVVLDGRPHAQTILPGDSKSPSLIVPLLMRGAVFGFVLYGPRRTGAALTSEECTLLETIARSAGAAYDHIDADRSHARIRLLEDRLRDLGAPVPDGSVRRSLSPGSDPL